MDAPTRCLCFVDPPRPGAINMGLDWMLLKRAEASETPLTVLRFYQWAPATVSLGKHQQLERAVNWRHCQRHGIPVIHRPTGGRAVYHGEELTYAVVSNDPALFPLHSISGTYQTISRGLLRGLHRLDEAFETAAGQPARKVSLLGQRQDPCFVSAARQEIVFRGRKVVGSAQRRLKRSFLQHGSIPLEIHYPAMAAALGVEEELLKSSVTSLSEVTGRLVTFQELWPHLHAGFQEVLETPIPVSSEDLWSSPGLEDRGPEDPTAD